LPLGEGGDLCFNLCRDDAAAGISRVASLSFVLIVRNFFAVTPPKGCRLPSVGVVLLFKLFALLTMLCMECRNNLFQCSDAVQ
jgi:hypothetical protein